MRHSPSIPWHERFGGSPWLAAGRVRRAVQRDGEHEWGVKMATLDNLGWTVTVDLEETDLEGREFPRRDVSRSADDWVWVWACGKVLHAWCGPGNLTEVLVLFRSWVKVNIP
ncbi:Imm53 family immunity protein [Streptomyces sviceus]|uniref:Imm53 family immunity protein n=1 Tax=Streptomyces sviceus TaxID=285530 RepID=UPI0036B34728